MGFEKNEIEVAMNNMYEHARLYEKIAEAQKLQAEGEAQRQDISYEKQFHIATAKHEAWMEAAKMLEKAVAVEREEKNLDRILGKGSTSTPSSLEK